MNGTRRAHARVGRNAALALAITLSLALLPTEPGLAAQAATEAAPPVRPAVPSVRSMEVVGGPGSANYRLAARFAPYKLDDLIHSTSVNPRWIEGSEAFWYDFETSEGKSFRVVDAARGRKRLVFDNAKLAAELTRITRDPYDARHLPIREIRFIDANTVEFEVESSQDEEKEDDGILGEQVDTLGEGQRERRGNGREKAKKKVHYFRYDVNTQTLRELEEYEEPDDHPGWASVSPDGSSVVYAKQNDLWLMSRSEYEKVLDARRGESGEKADSLDQLVEVEETRLTEDGEAHYGWASTGADRGDTDVEKEKKKDWRKPAPVVWSRDSRRLAMVRTDQRKVGELWVIHSVGNKRPELESYRYDMPGEEHVTQSELWIYDLAGRRATRVEWPDAWKDESLNIATARQFRYPDSTEPFRQIWLGDGSDLVHFARISRDRHRVDLMVADARTGQARTLFEDRLNTYMETRNPDMLPNGDILWWSERDGWAHLYRYGADGRLKNQVTQGEFAVHGIEAVDGRNGVIYFEASGREGGEDPYYTHLYRVGADGSGLRLLNPGNYDHRVSVGPSTRFFVDNYSRVNTVPAATLRNAAGGEVAPLETADFDRLMAAGWRMPEPFRVKAGDGITDLYGVMYLPFDFDPNRRYPIIAYVYPGPQTEAVSKSFSTNRYESALAQFGFVVITVGNRGGHPSRSKWYHNYGYGNLRDYGLEDKKVTIEQLADQLPFIDTDRVGIYGHSGGGFMSTAAMLVYPDFFDVAVSSSGNHTNDVYNRWWSETHHGVKEVVDDSGKVTFEYEIAKNPDLARNLKGHLLLTTGDIDNNVHHANTLRMAEALIKANKRFDYFEFPGQRHGYGNMSDYWFWLRAEYFVEHLLGDDTRWSADLVELQRENPRSR
ncbi:MAG TPA: DPP IV N-terminal domain-containing protein [Longimicrobiales bacterium]|nr:DPP IV N-terminal domain-containing protein [Longimicrobiales bacterium]